MNMIRFKHVAIVLLVVLTFSLQKSVAQFPVGVKSAMVEEDVSSLLAELIDSKDVEPFTGQLELSAEQQKSIRTLAQEFEVKCYEQMCRANGKGKAISFKASKDIAQKRLQVGRDKAIALRRELVCKVEATLFPAQMVKLRQNAVRQELLSRSQGDIIECFSLIGPHLGFTKSDEKKYNESIQKLKEKYQKEAQSLRRKYSDEIEDSLLPEARDTLRDLLGEDSSVKRPF